MNKGHEFFEDGKVFDESKLLDGFMFDAANHGVHLPTLFKGKKMFLTLMVFEEGDSEEINKCLLNGTGGMYNCGWIPKKGFEFVETDPSHKDEEKTGFEYAIYFADWFPPAKMDLIIKDYKSKIDAWAITVDFWKGDDFVAEMSYLNY